MEFSKKYLNRSLLLPHNLHPPPGTASLEKQTKEHSWSTAVGLHSPGSPAYSFPPTTPFHNQIFTLLNICSSMEGDSFYHGRELPFSSLLRLETLVLVASIFGRAICHPASLKPGRQAPHQKEEIWPSL